MHTSHHNSQRTHILVYIEHMHIHAYLLKACSWTWTSEPGYTNNNNQQEEKTNKHDIRQEGIIIMSRQGTELCTLLCTSEPLPVLVCISSNSSTAVNFCTVSGASAFIISLVTIFHLGVLEGISLPSCNSFTEEWMPVPRRDLLQLPLSSLPPLPLHEEQQKACDSECWLMGVGCGETKLGSERVDITQLG